MELCGPKIKQNDQAKIKDQTFLAISFNVLTL